MVDYMILDVARKSLSDALRLGKEQGFGEGAITIEVKNLPKANSVSKIHEFAFCEVMATDNFNHQDRMDFLRSHTLDAHKRHLRGEPIPSTAWGKAPIALGYKKLHFPSEPCDYSVAVGVMGDDSHVNEMLLSQILADLPEQRG